jgi:alcohol dehydrogenase class IV
MGLTAATGMDAIAHCIETFLAPSFNPPADGIALDGLERGWHHIRRAVARPSDREARRQMMAASLEGALAFQKGLGCVHSLSHSLGGLMPRLHHGTLNAVFLPGVVRFNAEAETVKADAKLQKLARAMGVTGESGDGAAVAQAITSLSAALSLPGGLEVMGVKKSLYGAIIERALADHCHGTNPRVASVGDYQGLLAAAS